MTGKPLWRIALTAPDAGIPGFTAALDDFCVSVSWMEAGPGLWSIEGICTERPDPRRLASALAAAAANAAIGAPPQAIENIADRDWLAENRKSFAPVRAGRYFVHATTYDGPVPAGGITLVLDAGLAFGSGGHETTRGCLLMLDRIARGRRPRRMLDLGTGSGILALAMARTWPRNGPRTGPRTGARSGTRPVLATDLDPVAVEVARANARSNGVAALIRFAIADGWRGAPARGRPYDLVTANILAGPLRGMARDFARHVAPGGRIVLSGILRHQEAAVRAAYGANGFTFQARILLGEWPTLLLQRKRAA